MNSAAQAARPLHVLGIGLLSPTARSVAEHLALVGAETSGGYSGQFLPEPALVDSTEVVLCCEWLPPQWQGAARIGALARLAAREALQAQANAGSERRALTLALLTDACLSEQERNVVAAAVCDEVGCSINTVLGGLGSCALVAQLSAQLTKPAPRRSDLLLVAADSWTSRRRLDARPARSPWEPAAVVLPSEGAAALLLRAGADAEPASMATVLWARDIKGPPRGQGIVDGGPLTQLFHQLPTMPAAITSVWGRTAGDIDRQLGLRFAAARVAAGAQPFGAECVADSLAHTTGQLGAAEMTAEMVFAIAASAKHAVALVWGAQDDGTWASCVLSIGTARPLLNAVPQPSALAASPCQPRVIELHRVRYLDLSEAGAFAHRTRQGLMQDALARADDRWRLPMREQLAVERRFDRQCAALLALLPAGLLRWLIEQEHSAACPLAEFVGSCLLSHSVARGLAPVDDLLVWLTGSMSGADAGLPCLWAGVEGLSHAGMLTAEALKVIEGTGAKAPAVATVAVLLHYGGLVAVAHPEQREALIDDLAPLSLDVDDVPPLLAATYMHLATYLDRCPWPVEALRRWLAVGCGRDARIAAARALILHSGPEGDEQLLGLLRDEDFIVRLGPAALELAALRPQLMDADWLEQLMGLLPASRQTLSALARAGHPRSCKYLLHYLADRRWQDAADHALRTLFGSPPQPCEHPPDWRAWIGAQGFDPAQRLRRGQPWSTDVVINEIASGELSRRQLQWRLHELVVALPAGDSRAAAARAIHVGAPIAALDAQLKAVTDKPLVLKECSQ